LDGLGLHFIAPRWIPPRLSDLQKADRDDLSQHMLDMTQGLGPEQQKYLVTADESWITGTINVAECGHKTEMSCHQM
jgi:hypothetical protein